MADVTDRPRSGRREGDAAVGAPLTHGREYADEELWTNYERFLEAVLPVAEEAGVEMCLHPDDPPVPSLGGVLWLFRSVDALKRAMELVPSDNHGLEFCLGTITEMGGEVTVLDAIDHFGSRDEITYVHFRDVEGTAPPVPRGVRERGELRRRRRRQRPRRRGVRGSSAPRPRPVRRGGAGVGVDRAGRTPSAAFRGCSTATTGPRDRRSTSALLETAAIRGPTHITPARGGRAVIRVA